MKLSIWQQFSSNHSGFFWIVGVFKSPDNAKKAQVEIQAMLKEIDTWHREHPDANRTIDDILPPEKAFAKKYNVDWPRTIDWTNWACYYLENHPVYPNYNAAGGSAACIADVIKVVQNLAIAANPDQTWMPMQPFKGLLEHFGATTVGFDFDHFEGWENWFLHIECDTPDEATVTKLHELPASIELRELTISAEKLHLSYEFQITNYNHIAGLVVVLKSNGCQNIHIGLIKKL